MLGALVFSSLLIAIIGGLLFWRLSRGPISMGFAKSTIQTQLNKTLADFSFSIDGMFVERNATTGMPYLSLRNISLLDKSGNTIAKASRAAIEIDPGALLRLQIMPRSLELIAPRIIVRRTVSGSFSLGYSVAADPTEENIFPTPASPSSTAEPNVSSPQSADQMTTKILDSAALIKILVGDEQEGASPVSRLEDIRISDASVQLYDEPNDATWFSPDSDFVFRRMPYGFVLLTNSTIASKNQPWKVDFSASYHKDRNILSLSGNVRELIPADASNKIFALSQLARVLVPLSGKVEMELSASGEFVKASAEFKAGRGTIGLPDFLANTVKIDEGVLQLDYDPVSGGVIVGNSLFSVAGIKTSLSGRIDPVRSPEGRLSAVQIDLHAKNDDKIQSANMNLITQIDIKALAAIEDAWLDIDNMTILSGQSGIQLHGQITGGDLSAGLSLMGTVNNLNMPLVQILWPPVLAPHTREWVEQNVQKATIKNGEFSVRFAPDGLEQAQRNKHLPADAVNARFSFDNVTSSYAGKLPPLQRSSGELKLYDNRLEVTIAKGMFVAPSGGKGEVSDSSLIADDLLGDITPAEIIINVMTSAPVGLEVLDLEPLNFIKSNGIDPTKFGGQVQLRANVKMPLLADISADQIVATATAHIKGASVKKITEEFDLTDGDLRFELNKTSIKIAGTAKLSGVPIVLTWSRPLLRVAKASAIIEANFDDKARERLGIKLGDFMSGPVKAKVLIPNVDAVPLKIYVTADMSQVAMYLDAINWRRKAESQTRASFVYYASRANAPHIDNLIVEGKNLTIKGNIFLTKTGVMKQANLSPMILGEKNRFSVDITSTERSLVYNIDGQQFDAKALISTLFSVGKNNNQTRNNVRDTDVQHINLKFNRLYGYNNETINNLKGSVTIQGNHVQKLDLYGTLASNAPIRLRLVPNGSWRKLCVESSNAGAVLRLINLYSKIIGGKMDLSAQLNGRSNALVRDGFLTVTDFAIVGEPALKSLEPKYRKSNNHLQKMSGLKFKKLTMPFSADGTYFTIGNSLIHSNELGASASGTIRKANGAMNIRGTLIPAYMLNAFVGGFPIIGDILTGLRRGEGIFGITFSLTGSFAKPQFKINPLSAIVPGIFRRIFDY